MELANEPRKDFAALEVCRGEQRKQPSTGSCRPGQRRRLAGISQLAGLSTRGRELATATRRNCAAATGRNCAAASARY